MGQPTNLNHAPLHSTASARAGRNSSAITLICLFQILTACCVFFAILRFSPGLAIIVTIITTPAFIRTAATSELYQRHGIAFGWKQRIRFFIGSMGLCLVTLILCTTVFALVSMAFGLFCVVAAMALGGPIELASDIAFLGTVGGMTWGFAGAIMALGLSAKLWQPKLWQPKLSGKRGSSSADTT